MSTPPKTTELKLEETSSPQVTAPTADAAPPKATEVSAPEAPASVPTDPKVLELVAMFPTIEVPVIEIVLETCGGSVDRAIETLLGMTDPNFKPDELGNARVREEDSQLDLDAELARKLQMEDDEHAASQSRGRRQIQQQQPQPTQYGYGDQQLPYQPRVSQRGFNPNQQQQPPYRQNSQPQQPQQSSGSELPAGMLLVEEKIGQFAEAGKRTFDSFFTKAKQKYSEYQAIGAGDGQGPSPVDTAWGLDKRQMAGAQSQPSPAGPPGPQGGLWGAGRSLSQRTESISSDSTSDSLAVPQPQTKAQAAPKRWQPSDTFEDDTSPVPRSYSFSNPPSRSPPPIEGSGSTPKGKIDMAKLGMLPKKRVDLLSTSPQAEVKQPSAHTKIPATPPGKNKVVDDDDDDDLEYTKNPFDER